MSGKRADRQKKIEYLRGYQWTLQSIERTKEKITERESKLYSVRSQKISDMPKGGTGKDVIDMIDYKDEAINELNRRLLRAKKKKDEIEECICAVGNERYILLLQLVYIEDQSLDEVADCLHLSYSRVTKLHGYALDLIEIDFMKKGKTRQMTASDSKTTERRA